MIRIALLCLLASACNDKAAPAADPHAKDLAVAQVKKLAFEGYPTWAVKHVEQACPKQLVDLIAEVGMKDIKDSWGHDLKMFCGADLPKGATGFAVVSAGPDGAFDTADDVRSWE